MPQLFFNASAGQAVFLWTSTSDRVKHDPALKNALARAEENARQDERNCTVSDILLHSNGWGAAVLKSGLLLAEIVNLANGETVGKPVTVNLVDRCLNLKSVVPMGNSLVIEDSRSRVLVFAPDTASFEASEARLRVFGHLADVDPQRQRFAVTKEAGRLVIYDAGSGSQISELKFSSPLLVARFGNQGHSLFAITTKHESITVQVP